jgi:hypothetical protein
MSRFKKSLLVAFVGVRVITLMASDAEAACGGARGGGYRPVAFHQPYNYNHCQPAYPQYPAYPQGQFHQPQQFAHGMPQQQPFAHAAVPQQGRGMSIQVHGQAGIQQPASAMNAMGAPAPQAGQQFGQPNGQFAQPGGQFTQQGGQAAPQGVQQPSVPSMSRQAAAAPQQLAAAPQGAPAPAPQAAPVQQAAPAPQAAPIQSPAPSDNGQAALNALAALGGFGDEPSLQASPAPQVGGPAPQAANPVGQFTASLPNGATVRLELNPNGSFRWTAVANGKNSNFEGTFTLENGSLQLIRGDNQKLEGTITQTEGGFNLRLSGQEDSGLNFVRG